METCKGKSQVWQLLIAFGATVENQHTIKTHEFFSVLLCYFDNRDTLWWSDDGQMTWVEHLSNGRYCGMFPACNTQEVWLLLSTAWVHRWYTMLSVLLILFPLQHSLNSKEYAAVISPHPLLHFLLMSGVSIFVFPFGRRRSMRMHDSLMLSKQLKVVSSRQRW